MVCRDVACNVHGDEATSLRLRRLFVGIMYGVQVEWLYRPKTGRDGLRRTALFPGFGTKPGMVNFLIKKRL